jgi:hypothetical protein
MQKVTSFRASDLPLDTRSRLLRADYRALDGARTFRRSVIRGCGLLALVFMIGTVLSTPSLFDRLFPLGLFVVPVTWAWMAELRLERRFARRLDGADRAVTQTARKERTYGRDLDRLGVRH